MSVIFDSSSVTSRTPDLGSYGDAIENRVGPDIRQLYPGPLQPNKKNPDLAVAGFGIYTNNFVV